MTVKGEDSDASNEAAPAGRKLSSFSHRSRHILFRLREIGRNYPLSGFAEPSTGYRQHIEIRARKHGIQPVAIFL